MSDETTPQDDAAMPPASTGSVASGWSEELVSVVADYRIEWRQPEGRQDALELLMRSAGGGGGMGGGHHGPYSATAVGKPRLSQPTLTDAEREAIWTVAEVYAENDGDAECEQIARIMQGLWQRTK